MNKYSHFQRNLKVAVFLHDTLFVKYKNTPSELLYLDYNKIRFNDKEEMRYENKHHGRTDWRLFAGHIGNCVPNRANTILNNCAHVLYLSGKDRDTMQYVADYLNQTVHTVLKLPRDKAVFIEEGAQARVVSKLTPYKGKLADRDEITLSI